MMKDAWEDVHKDRNEKSGGGEADKIIRNKLAGFTPGGMDAASGFTQLPAELAAINVSA